MSKKIIKLDIIPLTTGIQSILLDMAKKHGAENARYPVKEFEKILMEEKGISKKDAELVTEKIINTGIIRWEIFENNFVL